jgi:imidazoleglycerol-phosphate dehydratase
MARSADIQRQTTETRIRLAVDLDGRGSARVTTGVGFLDHMLELFARHALIDLEVQAEGDLHVDQHHTVEDVGICLGQAIGQAMGDKRGIRRYGHFTLPMDETLVSTAVDLSGRAFLVFRGDLSGTRIGEFDGELVEDFWQAWSANLRCNLHIQVHYGRNSHHICEGIFKCTARALRMAVEADPRTQDVPSTKGSL